MTAKNAFFDSFYEVFIENRHKKVNSILAGGGNGDYDLSDDAYFECWKTCKIVSRFMDGEAVNEEDCCSGAILGCPLLKLLSKWCGRDA